MENLEFSMSVTFFDYLDEAVYFLWLWLEQSRSQPWRPGRGVGDLSQRRMLKLNSNIAHFSQDTLGPAGLRHRGPAAASL